MAGPWYVRSTDGSDASDGLSWANAKATLAGAASAASAGDTIYVSQAHAETKASLMTITFPGTQASPNIVLCANDAAEPPTSVATSATVSTTGASNITISGNAYVYGITFSAASGSSSGSIYTAYSSSSYLQRYEQCGFTLNTTNTLARVRLAEYSANVVLCDSCTFTFSDASHGLLCIGASYLTNCATAGSAIYGPLFKSVSTNALASLRGCNIASMDASANIFNANSGTAFKGYVLDCKLPASWSGSVMSATPAAAMRVELVCSDSADTNYRVEIRDFYGTVVSDTGVYLDGGTTDGTTSLSYKFTTTANAKFGAGRFYGPEFVVWNEDTGSSKTATVEICHDGASAFTDGEIWLEVMYLGTSGYPLGTWASDAKAGYLASASAQASSSATWTGDSGTGPNGSTTWNRLKLTVAFTPQEKGVVIGRVVMGVASKSCYVDPNMTLS